ncbi:tryptophan synthase subunit alpha [Kiritimatiellaeota bacterium B1221]|nr:tryptophan synthase subunit alpha [Kiritimatiellaeota bacterium B1221]
MKATRIDTCFEKLRARGEKGFIAYITAGDPDLDATLERVKLLEAMGVDFIELGVPFSEPLADGEANQRAAERALAAGTTFEGILNLVRKIREQSEIPLVFFSYLNPLFVRGFDKSMQMAAEAGIDGVLLVDLSLEESGPYTQAIEANGLNHVVLITPTTPDARMEGLLKSASGFVYCVSRAGVTGEQSELQKEASSVLERAGRYTDLPLALGFGVSTPEQARSYSKISDAVVVGSYIVNTFHQSGNTPEGREAAADKISNLVQAVK